jgi:conjugative relaxase-like TrwC/TraI family protein
MFTIKVQSVKKAAEKYFDDHLSIGEFVTEGEAKKELSGPAENLLKYYTDQPITWQGSTTEKLGLKVGGLVTREQFSDLLDNIDPTTKKRLTARTSKNRRLYFDVTSSAPKSVSVMAITMGDTRLIRAHEEATSVALKEMENYVQTRVRTQSQNTIRRTGNLLSASVTHTTSRANDPQLHCHNLVFNVTWDETEGKFKALEAYEIYNNLEFFTENYRNHLAKKVRELGYEIEKAKHGWELRGVSKEVCATFSKRSASMKEAIKARELSTGREISQREIAIIAEQTRAAKSKNLSLKDAVELQKNQLSKIQQRSLENLLHFAKLEEKEQQDFKKEYPHFGKQHLEPSSKERDAVAFALAHIFERQSVASRNEIISLAYQSNYGETYKENLIKVLEETQGLVWDKDKQKVGTIAGLAQEYFITSYINNQKNKSEPIRLNSDPNSTSSLRLDQRNALAAIVQNRDKIMILEGGAGSGKSHILKNLTQILSEKEITVTATAPTSGATQNLIKDIGVETSTIQKILHQPSKYESVLKNGYLIVDEAGLLSIKQMEALFMVADKYNTRVLLVGDTKQHHGVEAGDALRLIKKYTDISVASLTEIERQKAPDYKAAVKEIQNMNVKKAWEIFEKMGVIHSKEDYLKSLGDDINITKLEQKLDYDKIYKTYLEKLEQNKSVLIVTPTRTEIDTLTIGIRENLSGTRLKDSKTERDVYASTRFTEAEKMSLKSYSAREENQYIYFVSNNGEFKRNSTWFIKEVGETNLAIENIKTKEIANFNPKELLAQQFDVLEKKTIEIREGEALLIQRNDKTEFLKNSEVNDIKHEKKTIDSVETKSVTEEPAINQPPVTEKNNYKFTNGELVTVKEIRDGNLLLEDGRTITEDIKSFDYGYVSTSYSSQGKTCDHVIVAMTNAGGRALSQEQFYVSTSRGRDGIDIFIEDKEYIKARIEELGDRPFNFEVADKEAVEKLKEVKSESMDQLKSKSLEIAEKFSLNNGKDKASEKEKNLVEKIVDKAKEVYTNWKDRRVNDRQKQIEPIKDQIDVQIAVSKQKIEKDQYPLEKEPMNLHDKIMNKGKDIDIYRDI